MPVDGLTSDKLDAEDLRRNSMSEYQNLVDEVESLKCQTCGGVGEYDDAGPGDIWFRMIHCTICKGTGFKDGKAYQTTPVQGGPVCGRS